MNPYIVAIIPARSGSKGIVDKNIMPLLGRPLLEWSIKACLKTPQITTTLVSTDSTYYRDLSVEFGAWVPFLRPQTLSSDLSPDIDFCLHALNFLESNKLPLPDYLVHIRPTTPLRDPLILERAINQFLESRDFTSMRSVHKMSESAYKSFEINSMGILQTVFSADTNLDVSNNARQIFANTYSPNGYIDVLNVSFILQEKLLHGNRVMPFLTDFAEEIDDMSDFNRCEYWAKTNPSIYSKLFS